MAGTGEGDASRSIANYQESLWSILEAVREAHANVLVEDEVALLRAVEAASGPSQRLLFRLYGRKNDWLRLEKLDYEDVVGPVEEACGELIKLSILQGKCPSILAHAPLLHKLGRT